MGIQGGESLVLVPEAPDTPIRIDPYGSRVPTVDVPPAQVTPRASQ